MSTYAPGSVDSPSRPDGQGSLPGALRKSIPMQFEFWENTGPTCQTSETSAPQTGDPTQGQPSSRPGIPASPSALPGSDKARRMTATSGRRLNARFKTSGPLGAFLKMFMGTSRWASTMCWLTWKASATPRGRLLFLLSPSMPSTEGSGSGLWQTPVADDSVERELGKVNSRGEPKLSAQVKLWATPRAEGFDAGKHRGKADSLHSQVKLFPTPTASGGGSNKSASSGAAIRPTLETMARKNLWPTPRANDAEKRGNVNPHDKRNGLPSAEDSVGGSLNPNWVEWLMGYPVGWTDLKDSETPSSPKSPTKSSA